MCKVERIGLPAPDNCLGCSACVAACARGALNLEQDERGFYRPSVDDGLCVGCGACSRACPVVGSPTSRRRPLKTMAAWDKDRARRLAATSGGMFMLLADAFVSQGGWVCGAAMNENMIVEHIVSNDINVIVKMRGSKYVQIRIDAALSDCLDLLKRGERVLFSGTSCQVDAMRRLARGRLSANLMTVDVLCHGAPSPRVWGDYVSYREREAGSKAVSSRFRKKDPSWTVFSLEMLFENGDRRSWCTVDDYYLRAFLGDYITQNACHSCPYTGTDRLSDITLADFWGYVSESCADRNTEDGISLVLVNSDAGMGLLKSVDGVHLIDKELGEAVKGNPPLRTVFPANGRSDEFWADYEKGGFDSVLDEYLGPRASSKKHQLSLWFNDHAYFFPGPLRRALVSARGGK